MSIVFVNTGQCGNQVGHEIIDGLWEHTKGTDECNLFFQEHQSNGNMTARSVHFDTEEKVVNACFERSLSAAWAYDRKSIANEYGGAGNNWAMGHNCTDKFLHKALNCVRRQIEACDTPATLLISHSVGGGTGSGLGTRLTEKLYDEFNDCTKVNFAITPYHFGEVIVQHYNTILCLSKIASCSDAVMLFENETAHHICRTMKMINTPTLFDINQAIAANIIPALLNKSDMVNLCTTAAPSSGHGSKRSFSSSSAVLSSRREKSAMFNSNHHSKSSHNTGSASNHIGMGVPVPWSFSHSHSFADDILDLCSHPDYKYLSVYNAPQSSASSIDFTYDSWMAILNSLGRNQLQLQQAHLNVNPPTRGTVGMSASMNCSGQQYSTPEKRGEAGSASPGTETLPQAAAQQSQERLPRFLKSVLIFRGLDPQIAEHDINNQYHTRNGSFHHYQRQQGGSTRSSPGMQSARNQDLNREVISKILSDYCTYTPLYTSSVATPVPRIFASHHLANRYQRSACLIANDTACVPILKRSLVKSLELYQANAYLHHYFDYGLEISDFTEALQSVSQTVQNYESL